MREPTHVVAARRMLAAWDGHQRHRFRHWSSTGEIAATMHALLDERAEHVRQIKAARELLSRAEAQICNAGYAGWYDTIRAALKEPTE